MAYIGRKPTDAPLTSADIQNGTITNDDLASGVAVANIGYTPANAANLAGVATSGSYTDLINKPTIPTVPTTVSTFTNDAGYLTSFTETDPVFSASAAAGVTSTKITNWDAAYGWGNHASAGYLASSTAASTYLALAGGALTGGLREKRVAMSANDIDISAGNWFTKTISGATTLTVSNVPAAGTVGAFVLDLTNGGAGTITWWSGIKWEGGTAPTLTASGRDVIGFFTHDGGTTWTGVVRKDFK